MNRRPRRNRQTQAIRNMVQETQVPLSSLVYPLFVTENERDRVAIDSMPGQFRLGLNDLLVEMEACFELGVQNFVLFPAVPDAYKDASGSYSYRDDNFYLEALRRAKRALPDATLITDVALDPYSSDGHDGIVSDGKILNDKSLPVLACMAIAQAEAGADIVGPSDMMDGRVGAIREALDAAGHTQVGIMSYTAKYASAFYGPFRDALDSAPKFGDKKTYQMNPANRRVARTEARLDEAEGADFLMVKPALPYLDIIRELRDTSELPIAAYNVSGEYAMVKAAAARGWLDETAVMRETLTAIRRAGADVILTYFARQYAEWVREQRQG